MCRSWNDAIWRHAGCQKVKEDIQKLNNLCTTVDDLKSQYEITKREVGDFKIAHQSIVVMKVQMATIESYINNLKSSVASVEKSVGDASLVNLDSSTASAPDLLVAEVQDHLCRSANIILYKAPTRYQI